jgi:N-acetylmuramic acid 6-phosphate etherase
MAGTETIDARYTDIDAWPIRDAVAAMVEGQKQAAASLEARIDPMAQAADAAADRLSAESGRLVYVGAGTSGRVAVQDGVELYPTFGWNTKRLVYIMAGGEDALTESAEGAEDDAPAAAARIAALKLGHNDVVIAVAASGRTPFTVQALKEARACGALTIAIANNSGTPLLDEADHPILLDTGSEIISGSTRMKAGTAQKAGLNILSTAIMLKLGKVYRGQMVDMIISNTKLRQRAINMVQILAGCTEQQAIAALEQADNHISPAVLIALGQSAAEANALLARHGGILRKAVDALGEATRDTGG